MTFFHVPALLVTVGGTLLSVLVQFSLSGTLHALQHLLHVMRRPLPTAATILRRLRSYAITARRDGLRQLEADLPAETDSFMRLGLELIAAETDKDSLQSALDRECLVLDQKYRSCRRLFEMMASAAPAWGMIGTLFALIQMFSQLNDARQIGPSLAMALTTTLYGVLMANLIFIPVAGRLETRHTDDLQIRQMMQEGLLAMNEEYSPVLIEERLRAWLPAGAMKAAAPSGAEETSRGDSVRAA